jgi:D-alanyl-D-alanine carboxypeptidase
VSERSVLQGGRMRHRSRPPAGQWRHGAGIVLLTTVLAVAAMLAFMAARASEPEHAPRAAGRSAVAVVRHPPQRSGYGVALAPAAERFHVKLRTPLRSGLVFDVNTGQVLWERGPQSVVAIASLTKMMTALIVVAHARPGAQVLVTKQALGYSGSGVGLLPLNKRVPLETMLYGLMLPSGNDAAIALAQHVAGSERRFVAMMNDRAREMGLGCTHFSSVSGILDAGNYSCASDLAVLAHAVVEQPLLHRIVASSQAVLPFPIKGGKLYLYNNNPLLRLGFPGVDGVKTGYTNASGPCLVATAHRGRSWLGVVLLHSGDVPDQAKALLTAGFAAAGRGA